MPFFFCPSSIQADNLITSDNSELDWQVLFLVKAINLTTTERRQITFLESVKPRLYYSCENILHNKANKISTIHLNLPKENVRKIVFLIVAYGVRMIKSITVEVLNNFLFNHQSKLFSVFSYQKYNYKLNSGFKIQLVDIFLCCLVNTHNCLQMFLDYLVCIWPYMSESIQEWTK